jgi:hypothetical protein
LAREAAMPSQQQAVGHGRGRRGPVVLYTGQNDSGESW